jgi:hypothetical protein
VWLWFLYQVSKPMGNMKRPKSSKVLHCIYFFGSNNFAWIEEFCIKPYEPFKDTLSKTCKTVLFKQACNSIEDYIARKERGEDVEKEFEEREQMEEEAAANANADAIANLDADADGLEPKEEDARLGESDDELGSETEKEGVRGLLYHWQNYVPVCRG